MSQHTACRAPHPRGSHWRGALRTEASQRASTLTLSQTMPAGPSLYDPLVGHTGMQATAAARQDAGVSPVVSNPAMNSVATWPISSSSVMGLPARAKPPGLWLPCDSTVTAWLQHAGPGAL